MTSPEYTPQQIAEYRLQRDIDALIERNRNTYQEREEEMLADEKPAKPMTRYQAAKRDARGSKKGVKRGKYKQAGNHPKTKLATSEYYSKSGDDLVQ